MAREGYFGENDINPDFLTEKSAKADSTAKAREDAKILLKNQEKSALNPSFSYTGTGKPASTQGRRVLNSTRASRTPISTPGSRVPKSLQKLIPTKKSIPTLLLIVLLCAGGAFLFSSNSLLGPQINSSFTNATDTQYASTVLRSQKLGLKNKFGRAGGFFDQTAEKTYKKLGLSRDIFHNFKQTSDAKTNEENYRNTMSDLYEPSGETKLNTVEDRTTTDEDGNTITERVKSGEDVDAKLVDGDTAEVKASRYVNSVSAKAARGSGGAAIGCAILRVGNMISVAVAANELYQSIQYFMNMMEPISKMMAGEGSSSAINETLNSITKTTTTTVSDPNTGENIELTGSFLQSEGARTILGGVTPNQQKSSLFSLGRLNVSTISAALTSNATYRTCNIARGTSAGISLAISAIPGGSIVKAVVGLLIDTGVQIAVGVAISGFLSILIPQVAKALFSNFFESQTGIAAGEAFTRGASAANTRLGRSASGQAVSDEAAALAYSNTTTEIIAAEAAEDRKNRSPFDITSENTFLGSLVRKFMVVNFTSSTLTNFANTFSSLTKNSITTTFAAGTDTTYMTTFGDCPELEQIHVKGDIYCNPITTTDLSTIDLDPNDPTYRSIIDPNLEIDEEGNEKIKDNSNLARYIIFCTERDSPFGVEDANIASALETSFGTVGDNLPILGDVVDIINAIEDEVYSGWVDGSICANSAENDYWDREMKYYQRYIEDERLLSRENGTENPVTAYKEAYYEANPLDNSTSGYLARISGLSKDDAEEVLAILDYLEFVNDYDPSLAYSFMEGTSSISAINISEQISFFEGHETWASAPERSEKKAYLFAYSREDLVA